MNKLQAHNEMVINAPIGSIWAIITDINQLHRVNPGVTKATGRMDTEGCTRTCEMNNNGKKGTMTERLMELVPEKRTVWTVESDTVGISRMFKDTRFCFNLEKVNENSTMVVNETYYRPANIVATVLNVLMMRRMFGKAQEQILQNIKSLTEK